MQVNMLASHPSSFWHQIALSGKIQVNCVLLTITDALESKSSRFFGGVNGLLPSPSPSKERGIKEVRLINNPFPLGKGKRSKRGYAPLWSLCII